MGAISKREQGFSLIELSILIAVMGILAASLLSVAKTKVEDKDYTASETRLEEIENALLLNVNKNGRLPCPADPTAALGGASFGVESDCTAAASGGLTDILPSGGVSGNDDIRVGMVPVRALGLPNDYAFDEWGSRLTYVTIKKLASATEYASFTTTLTNGVITVEDENGTQLTGADTTDIVSYVVLSHGKDKKGAYTKSGVAAGTACDDGTSALDIGNCDWGGSAPDNSTFVVTEIHDEARDSNYFYDVIAYREYAETGSLEETTSAPTASTSSSYITAGGEFTCGITTAGELQCWGYNYDAQLGRGTYHDGPFASPAAEALGKTDWVTIEFARDDPCAIDSAGDLYCWGWPDYGEVANGTTSTIEMSPSLAVGSISNWTHISGGQQRNCGIADGKLYCWGLGGVSGIWGDPNLSTPTQVGTDTDWIYVDVGWRMACGIRGTSTEGTLYCWGDGAQGRLGTGDTSDQTTPQVVGGGYTDWTQVASSGNQATCGLRSNGEIYCWGDKYACGMNDSSTGNQYTPRAVDGGFTDWEKVVAGHDIFCGIRSGRIYCWGYNQEGEVGTTSVSVGGYALVPTEIDGGYTDWVDITDGQAQHFCALRSGGTMYCWGQNDQYQLGLGHNTTPVTSPTVTTTGLTFQE
jgi:alpha-tubulin suppressor-like RCC1 family protein/type II secretory pathway pseudopilin PulG